MNNINYDDINNLPTTNYRASPQELNVVNTLFDKENKSKINNILYDFKDAAIIGIVFIVLAAPLLDDIINKYIPFTKKSIYYVLIVKTIVFIIITWFLQNKYLAVAN